MKTTLVSILCLCGTWTMAQNASESRLIKADFSAGSTHTEQAIHTLSATNKVAETAQVEYKAGKSVVLLPGFEAKPGAVFVAHVGEVSIIATVEGQMEPMTITAHPNPFDESTTISYTLTKAARVSLFISDAKGALLNRLVDNVAQEVGRHDVEWRGGVLAAGTYVCTVSADQQQVSNRLVKK